MKFCRANVCCQYSPAILSLIVCLALGACDTGGPEIEETPAPEGLRGNYQVVGEHGEETAYYLRITESEFIPLTGRGDCYRAEWHYPIAELGGNKLTYRIPQEAKEEEGIEMNSVTYQVGAESDTTMTLTLMDESGELRKSNVVRLMRTELDLFGLMESSSCSAGRMTLEHPVVLPEEWGQ